MPRDRKGAYGSYLEHWIGTGIVCIGHKSELGKNAKPEFR